MKDDLIYERDRNAKLGKQVDDARKFLARYGDELKRMESDQEGLIRENQEVQYLLQKSIAESEDLEREQVYNHERLRDAATHVDQGSVNCLHVQQEIHLIRLNIEALIAERNDIIMRVNEISREYEMTGHQLNEERAGVEIENA